MASSSNVEMEDEEFTEAERKSLFQMTMEEVVSCHCTTAAAVYGDALKLHTHTLSGHATKEGIAKAQSSGVLL